MFSLMTDRVDALAGVQARLCSIGEVTEDLEGVSGAALVGVNPVLSCRGRQKDKADVCDQNHGPVCLHWKGYNWSLQKWQWSPHQDQNLPGIFTVTGWLVLPSLSSGWLRCRSWQVRAGLSWVPRGKRMVSISCRSELRDPKISSMPSLPIRNSVPVASDAGMSASVSGSSWLASIERLDLGLLWMGRGWMTSPGGPYGAGLHFN